MKNKYTLGVMSLVALAVMLTTATAFADTPGSIGPTGLDVGLLFLSEIAGADSPRASTAVYKRANPRPL